MEPVRLDANDNGVRIGLGRQEVDRQVGAACGLQQARSGAGGWAVAACMHALILAATRRLPPAPPAVQYTAAENIERRMLEAEIQADEDEDRKRRREVGTFGSDASSVPRCTWPVPQRCRRRQPPARMRAAVAAVLSCPAQMEAERQNKIREEVKHELRMFYCEVGVCSFIIEGWAVSAGQHGLFARRVAALPPAPAAPAPHAAAAARRLQWCHKQYKAAHEMEEHLSSYDHHHRKRLAEMRVMTAQRSKKERGKKERKRAEREMQRMAEQ